MAGIESGKIGAVGRQKKLILAVRKPGAFEQPDHSPKPQVTKSIPGVGKNRSLVTGINLLYPVY